MIDMFDRDKSGQINVQVYILLILTSYAFHTRGFLILDKIQEFTALFAYINQWKSLFEGIDRDRSGFIEEGEFGQALQQMGYRFSPTFVQVTSRVCHYYHCNKKILGNLLKPFK